MISTFISTTIKLYFVLTPFFVLSMFLALTRNMAIEQKRRLAVRVGVAVFAISLVLYFFGELLFTTFGITLDAFRIGAGALLFLSAINLVQDAPPGNLEQAQGDISVVPLAIPITVGPATIGTLMIMGAGAHNFTVRAMGCLALLTATASVGITLYFSDILERLLGALGITILTKITGLILAALAAQIIFTGVRNFLLVP